MNESPQTNEFKKQSDPAIGIYGVLLLCFSFAFAFQLYVQGVPTFIFALVPAVCIVAVFLRWQILLQTIPFAVFLTLALFFVFRRFSFGSAPSGSTVLVNLPLALSGFLIIAAGARLHTLLHSTVVRAMTRRISYAPTQLFPTGSQASSSHWISILFVVIAWVVAGYLNWDFDVATRSREYFDDYRQAIDGGQPRLPWAISQTRFGGIRLVPWAVNGIRLTMILGAFFAVAHGVLSYLRCRNNAGKMSAILLRHELWKWNRWEQKKIAKAMKKQGS